MGWSPVWEAASSHQNLRGVQRKVHEEDNMTDESEWEVIWCLQRGNVIPNKGVSSASI
jgi:hypothetical protein